MGDKPDLISFNGLIFLFFVLFIGLYVFLCDLIKFL